MSLVNQSIIKHKVGLLNLAEQLQNVSQGCRVMDVSRDTFYRIREAKESGGLEALLHKDRRRPNPKNRVDEAVEQAVLSFAIENPAAGQVRVSNELRKRGVFVSPTGVRSIWLRHSLHTFRLRLAGLEKKVADEGLLLTENQVAALERKREEQLETGEIETAEDFAEVERLQGIYTKQITDRITRVLQMMLTKTEASATPCIVHVVQNENGDVLDVDMRTAHVREQLATAIRAASPLPTPPQGLAMGSYLTIDATAL